jgi:two-component system sensor histidine kinase/response regulator
MSNSVVFYASMLKKFVAAQEDATALIARHMASGDSATAERLAHTLRGVAGNLGATSLQLRAEQLETCIRTGAHAQALADASAQCADALSSLTAALKGVPGLMEEVPVADPASLSEAERVSGAAAMQQIRQMLAEDNAAAKELWDAHAGVLRALCTNAAQVEAAIDAFDFEEALRIL